MSYALPIVEPNGSLVVACVGLRERLGARLRGRRLDRELAAGTPPDSSAALALRAQRLISLGTRRKVARALRRAMWQAVYRVESTPFGRIPVAHDRVIEAGPALSQLLEAVVEPGPVEPRGMAQALLLVTDGCGPLYNARNGQSLAVAADAAASALRYR
jgi:hypothetical protein